MKEKAGLESGTTRIDGFKGGPEHVAKPAPKSQIPTMTKQKVKKDGRTFTIC